MTTIGKAGLAILGIISLGDAASPLLTDGEHPPLEVALLACVLGVASIVLVALAWGGHRWALVPLLVLRAASALSAIPAFLVGDAPAAAQAAAAGVIALTVIGSVLAVADRRMAVSR